MTVVLEGFHAVKHALRFAPTLVTTVTVRSIPTATALSERLAPDITAALLALAVEGEVNHPTGVYGEATRPEEDRNVLTTRTSPLLVLDDPKHAGNAGAAIRVAAAAGASGLAVVGALDPWHPAVVRGAAGLHFALPVLTCHANELKGTVLALDADGEPFSGLPDDAVLVVGSERAGISPAMRDRADGVVSLPMREGVSSLNLATAASAALYAWRLGTSARLR
jgi:TrmH family RNA methyltransferase